MVIDFNTNRIPSAEPNQATTRKDSPPPASDSASFSNLDSLNSQMGAPATVRPEKVAAAKDLVADSNYPSDHDLSRIAGLLASHMETDSTSQSG